MQKLDIILKNYLCLDKLALATNKSHLSDSNIGPIEYTLV